MLQVAMVWRGQILGYRLLSGRRKRITVGPSKRATFVTPALAGQPRFLLLSPRKDGFTLHLAPSLRGELHLAGSAVQVEEVAAGTVDFSRGDRGRLIFADASDLRLEMR